MTLLEYIQKINKSNWADWELRYIKIDFDIITIRIEYTDDNNILEIICKNHIYTKMNGPWDDFIISSITIRDEDSLIHEAISNIKVKYGDSPVVGGGTRHISDKWFLIEIQLIDELRLLAIFNEIEVNEICD